MRISGLWGIQLRPLRLPIWQKSGRTQLSMQIMYQTSLSCGPEATQVFQRLAQRRLKHPQVPAVRNHAEALSDEVPSRGQVGGHDAGDFAMFLAGSDDPVHRRDQLRISELARNAHRNRQ